MLKCCCLCGEEKEISFFNLKRGKPGARCKSCSRAAYKTYREKNKEKETLRHKKYWDETKNSEKSKLRNSNKCRTYRKNHPEYFRFSASNYRSKKLNATPVWADLREIEKIYLNCPSGYEVDHIIPLNNKFVCGLHIPSNLQYLPTAVNRQKRNHLDYKI